MTFAREKRLLLGLAAIGVAIPLPLTDALDWPSLALFMATVGVFLRRVALGSERWLSRRALNLLGLAYFPLLAIDIRAHWPGPPVRAILHLILFGLAAKLCSLERERDKWQAWIGIFFVFVASMATSTHPSVVAYLVAFLAFSVLLLLRFVHLHLLSSYAGRRAAAPPLGAWRATTTIVVATVTLAVPLFALLPRVRSPFVSGPGALGGDSGGARVGFSDEMSLDLIGRLRDNRAIAARVALSGRHPVPEALRLRAGMYEAWAGRTWLPAPGRKRIGRSAREGRFRVAPGRAVGQARISLEPLRSPSLVIPVETVAIELEKPGIEVSSGGALGFGGLPEGVQEYTALLAAQPVSPAPPPARDSSTGPLDPAGLTPELAALAVSWAGEGTDAERAARIEARLIRDYVYTTELVGRGGESPIEDFLLRNRRGHCEYFASSMVLLLRAQGIPARLATGFYGAEWSVWERTWVVRQSNAHAWVEAYLTEGGWTVFDPTPPEGRPAPSATGLWSSMQQAWDAVAFRWDRWVISYDFDDQLGALGGLRSWWARFWRRFTERPQKPPTTGTPGASATPDIGTPEGGERDPRWAWPWILAALLVSSAGAFLLLRGRGKITARRAYLGLRASLAGAGLAIPDSLAPLALSRLVEQRAPAAAMAANRVIGCYVRDTFGGRTPSPAEVARLRASLLEVERWLRPVRRELRARARSSVRR